MVGNVQSAPASTITTCGNWQYGVTIETETTIPKPEVLVVIEVTGGNQILMTSTKNFRVNANTSQ